MQILLIMLVFPGWWLFTQMWKCVLPLYFQCFLLNGIIAVFLCNKPVRFLFKLLLELFLFLRKLAVTGCKYDLILTENRMLFELFCQSLCTINTIQEPEGMFQLCAEFGRWEREFLLWSQCFKKTVNRLLIHKIAVCFDRKEQITNPTLCWSKTERRLNIWNSMIFRI